MGRVLWDTHSFLWLITDNPRLSRSARQLYLDGELECWLSYVSIWEMAVKHSLKKLPLPQAPHRIIASECARYNISLLPISLESIYLQETLPFHHRDPFDRLLVCQSLAHDMPIITTDGDIKKYKVRTLW